MNIEGTHTIETSPSAIWDILIDPVVLARITPGINELTQIEEDKYLAIAEIKIGPVKGKFEGQFEMKDKVEKESVTLLMDQKSKIGNVLAEIGIRINDMGNGHSEILYEGTAKLSGRIASIGQRIIGGVISTMSKQFFQKLEKEIQ